MTENSIAELDNDTNHIGTLYRSKLSKLFLMSLMHTKSAFV